MLYLSLAARGVHYTVITGHGLVLALPTYKALLEYGEGVMAFQSVPQTAEIVIKYEGNQVDSVNVLQAKLTGGYSLTDLEDLADAVDASIVADWLPIQTQDQAYISTTVRGLEFINDQETINTDGAGAGGNAVKGLPGSVTFSVKKSSGLTGRSARGRMYWIGIPSDKLAGNENQVLSAHVVEIRDAVEDMRLAIAATSWDPVIVSRFLDGSPRATGAVFNWIATVAVNENVDSQRRRLTT